MRLAISTAPAHRNWFLYPGLLAVLLLISVAFTVPYINSQQAFLGGDINDGFYQLTLQVVNKFHQSPLAAFQLVCKSLNGDYNKLFSLPLLPFFLIFGDSYLVYVLSLAIVYLLPFLLVVGAIATQLIPVYPKAVFISTTLLAATITPNWVTIFQGYPDISAAVIIALSLWVCLWKVGRNLIWLFPYRWQIPVLGFLFSFAILLRRHFAYAVVAVLGAICLYTAIVFGLQLRHNPRLAWRNLGRFGVQIGLVIATCLVTLLLLAWTFTVRAFTEDYVSLYDSWSRPWQVVFSFYGLLYGWSIWGCAIVGLIAGALTGILSIPATLLIGIFGTLSTGLWLLKLRYTETYYALHFAPFVLLGLSAFAWTIGLKLKAHKRSLFLALFSLLLLVNAVFGITSLGNVMPSAARSWWAASFPPPVRSDYDRVVQVVNFLRQLAPAQEPIFVAYTARFPMHLIRGAEATLYGEDRILNLTQGSATDSDGSYPLSKLLAAQYVVVTQPFVDWNAPEQQTVKAVFDLFTQGWEFAQDFAPLPQQFQVQDGVVTIYQRMRPTSIDRAARTLHDLQVQVNKPLGKQLDWIALSPSLDAVVKRSKNRQRLNLSAVFPDSSPDSNQNHTASFLYLGALPQRAEVKGRAILSKSCPGMNLSVSPLNQQGQPVHPAQTLQLTQAAPLKLQLNTSGAIYLLLQTSPIQPIPQEAEPCLFKLNAIQVASAPD